jgi:hypothetical protein
MHPLHAKALEESTKRDCFHCRHGEVHGTPVDWYVEGRYGPDLDGACRPFRGYVCDDHLDVLMHDAQEVRTCRPVSPAAWARHAGRLWVQYVFARDSAGALGGRVRRLHAAYCRAQDYAGLND